MPLLWPLRSTCSLAPLMMSHTTIRASAPPEMRRSLACVLVVTMLFTKSVCPPANRREGIRVVRSHEWIVLSHDAANSVFRGAEGDSARDVRGAVDVGER